MGLRGRTHTKHEQRPGPTPKAKMTERTKEGMKKEEIEATLQHVRDCLSRRQPTGVEGDEGVNQSSSKGKNARKLPER